jgi:hypothetical protein
MRSRRGIRRSRYVDQQLKKGEKVLLLYILEVKTGESGQGGSGSLVWRTPSFACGLPPPKFKHETCAHHLGE